MSEYLYKFDNPESWADYASKNPPPPVTKPPYKTDAEREVALRYMAGYYNMILVSGGQIPGEIALINPYVLVWNGAVQKFMPREEAATYGGGSGNGITFGPMQVPTPLTVETATGVPSAPAPFTHATGATQPVGASSSSASSTSTPVPVSRVSLWQRIKAWFRRLFS